MMVFRFCCCFSRTVESSILSFLFLQTSDYSKEQHEERRKERRKERRRSVEWNQNRIPKVLTHTKLGSFKVTLLHQSQTCESSSEEPSPPFCPSEGGGNKTFTSCGEAKKKDSVGSHEVRL